MRGGAGDQEPVQLDFIALFNLFPATEFSWVASAKRGPETGWDLLEEEDQQTDRQTDRRSYSTGQPESGMPGARLDFHGNDTH